MQSDQKYNLNKKESFILKLFGSFRKLSFPDNSKHN